MSAAAPEQARGNGRGPRLERTMFETSRLLEYFTERELRYQTGRSPTEWPIVIVKELVDNALDSCEDAGVAPAITVTITDNTITVTDNGPGIATETLERILDFATRTSDKEAYVSPTRGAQGNALKTVVAIPYVTSAEEPKVGHVTVTSQGVRHDLIISTDLLRQEPRINHDQTPTAASVTSVDVTLDYRGILAGGEGADFYKLLQGYVLFNPHASFRLETAEEVKAWPARQPDFAKWMPSDPTSPWWYTADDLGRLIAAHAVHANNGNRDLPLRELVAQFRGLSSTRKQKVVTSQLPQKRVSDFVRGGDLDTPGVAALLAALKDKAKPAKPQHLGVLGEENIRTVLSDWYELESDCFNYFSDKGYEGGLPYVLEIVLGRKGEGTLEKYLGLNFAPTYGDPFAEARLEHATKRDLFAGTGLNALLSEFKVQMHDPLVLVVHLAYPRPRFRDRGKSGLQLEGAR